MHLFVQIISTPLSPFMACIHAWTLGYCPWIYDPVYLWSYWARIKKSFFVLLGFLWRSKVCHGKYGCFYRHRNLSVRLPQRPSRVGTSFHLFTRNNRQIAQSIDDRDVTKLKKSFFKIQRQTILLVHGFTVTGESMN